MLRFLSVANKRGYTHRRITPDTLARLESGTPIIAGWQNGDDASAAPNIALDQVQLLLLLAVLIGPERAVTAGRDVLGDDTMISLTPFIQKAAVPAGTRALPGWNKHIVDDMRAEMRALAPQETAERGVTVSALRAAPEQFAAQADFPVEPSPFCKAAFVVHQPDFKPGRHPYHHAGVFYSQEP